MKTNNGGKGMVTCVRRERNGDMCEEGKEW